MVPLFAVHRGKFSVSEWPRGNWRNLSRKQRATVRAVYKYCGPHTGHWLRELTHSERPWKEARKGLPPSAPSKRQITLDSMALYYGSL